MSGTVYCSLKSKSSGFSGLSTLSDTRSLIDEEVRQAKNPQESTLLAAAEPLATLHESSPPAPTQNNIDIQGILNRDLDRYSQLQLYGELDYYIRYLGGWSTDRPCGDEFDSYSGLVADSSCLGAQFKEQQFQERQLEEPRSAQQTQLEQKRLEEIRLEKEQHEQDRILQIRLEEARLEQARLKQIRFEQTKLDSGLTIQKSEKRFACRFDKGCEKEFGKKCDRLKHEKDQHEMHGCATLYCKYQCGRSIGGTRRQRMKEHERHCKRMNTITRKVKLCQSLPIRVYEEN